MKLYGKHQRACYRHRSIIGGAVVRIGKCEHCESQVSSGVGSPPKLCVACSKALNQCMWCRVDGDGK